MAGIVGIQQNDRKLAERMLLQLSHRGESGSKIIQKDGVTIGANWPEAQESPTPLSMRQNAVWDTNQPPLPEPEMLDHGNLPFSIASTHIPGELFLARDLLGISPLYFGFTKQDRFCFASEVKALLEVATDIQEFPPGSWFSTKTGFKEYKLREKYHQESADMKQIAQGLLIRLEQAVCERISGDEMGAWLSGGLDSSAIVGLARPHLKTLHTFAAGLEGAPDLYYAKQVADKFQTNHHEVVVSMEDILHVLPLVIYHLESFDALLVRSSVTNYLVAGEAAKHIDVSFSGEGADELFAGYEYMQDLTDDMLDKEMETLPQKLHNTALQRVDRSAAAHGLVVHVPFLDPDVVAFAREIPVDMKMKREPEAVEKYILRQALVGILPDSVLWRRKSKFWQGTGLGELLSDYADKEISQAEFNEERHLPNGWELNTKEELLYYRIFKSHFGELEQINWVGRTKGAPKDN